MKYIAVKIHNNALGKVFSCESEEEAKEFVKGMAEEQFGRKLTEEEEEELKNNLEIYDDSDQNNIYSFSVGLIENE